MVTLAIIGDPHFEIRSKKPGAKVWTYNSLEEDGSAPKGGPWNTLLQHVEAESLRADALICAGDLGTKGAPDSLKRGWKHIVTLGKQLDAGLLMCATGNHDLRTRFDKDEIVNNPVRELGANRGLSETLKMLDPIYPVTGSVVPKVEQEKLRTQYFGDSLASFRHGDVRYVVLNSCCEHTTESTMYERGSFPDSAHRELARELSTAAQDTNAINVLVCHHPPHAGDGAYDFIQRGPELLKLIDGVGPWLVVHGHKHHGDITYAEGVTDNTPVILSAGSLGAVGETMGGSGSPVMTNQFYLVDVDLREGRILGAVRAWNWFEGTGWREATPKYPGLPFGCGFGHRASPDELAKSIVTLLVTGEKDSWENLRSRLPELRHCAPKYVEKLQQSLNSFGYTLVAEHGSGKYSRVEKRGDA